MTNRLHYYINIAFLILLIFFIPNFNLYASFGYITFIPFNLLLISLGLYILIINTIIYRENYSVTSIITYFLFLYIAFLIVINYDITSFTEDGRHINAFRYYTPFILINLCCFNSCKYIYRPCNQAITNKITTILFYLYLIFLFIIYINFFSYDYMKVDYSKIIDSSFIGVYQLVGDSFAFLSLLYLYVKKTTNIKSIILILISMVVLYTLNSRSSFFCYFVAILVSFFIKMTSSRQGVITLVIIISSLYIIYIVDLTPINNVLENIISSNGRMKNILTGDFHLDNSFVGRVLLFKNSLHIINEYPITGLFGNQANSNIDGLGLRWGGYTHSILSYWDQFGFLAFSIISTLVIYLIKENILIYKNENNIFSISLLIFIILEQTLLKSFNYYYIFMLIGLIEGKKYVNKCNINY